MMSTLSRPQAKPGNETRTELIRVGSDIIARRGFNNTGINVVLKEAGVPKGSFYYYFSSKEDFGLAVIDDFAAASDARLDSTLGDSGQPPLVRIRRYLDSAIADMAACDFCRGCLIGNLGQELAGQNEAFRERLDSIFSAWQRRFADCLAEARDRGDFESPVDPDALAQLLQMGWQGATLRAKVSKSVAPMERFATLFFETVLGVPVPAA
ncbi:TetR family transcriptional regulator [Marinobacter halodurans]|uniref:TetR family transcriptional regulator n=1 Tax=Marinobacter halodurans TaxID=2528979 RepID=A0ABY1ZPN0_9GAMM|nr:TetR/AcrR family transcriptional regulator [Marinobacter halodurans]TBW58790.1 TetR family transcriptional regulator [Marinobacter halodurans]